MWSLGGCRIPHLERFQPRWYVYESHNSGAQSCWRMSSFENLALEMRRRSENLLRRFQDTEPPLEGVLHRASITSQARFLAGSAVSASQISLSTAAKDFFVTVKSSGGLPKSYHCERMPP